MAPAVGELTGRQAVAQSRGGSRPSQPVVTTDRRLIGLGLPVVAVHVGGGVYDLRLVVSCVVV